MKAYTAPTGTVLWVSETSILATADSGTGIHNAGANLEDGYGKLYPVRP